MSSRLPTIILHNGRLHLALAVRLRSVEIGFNNY